LAERYLREWLSQQAASGYLTYDPSSCRFALSPEQAAVLADEDSPVYMVPAFDCRCRAPRQPADGAGSVRDRRGG
jgi:hypothetical protein